ncbi:DUF1194 domain-containing protein [Rhizobium sp. TH2]|uniref:DUF1194 domain-containing protein n=1 Tax=Rhizobium sp. TH2 TaxID=2775403 RepID=UPI0021578933|nr:DUF1194 domain-containing protein [Rhizobium sp. TH2]UVC10926.1 DUF1194 domain-containing protein [Rhizobium sp. TH2]
MTMHSFVKLTGTIAVTLILGLQARASGIDQASTFDVDVAIVFAVDSSSSIDRGTADLQRNGHVAALTSPEFIKALSGNHLGCIGITYFEWASPQQIRTVLPWTRICGRQDAEAAARVISRKGATGFSRGVRGGTSISAAIGVASLLLDRFPGNADRKVIDISGNGENNDGLPVLQAREKAIDKGYTINAIAIPSKDEAALGRPLASYFAEDVIGGFQAFVMVPRSTSDYTKALRRKLVTEIALNIGPNLANSEERLGWRLVTTVADARYGASKW